MVSVCRDSDSYTETHQLRVCLDGSLLHPTYPTIKAVLSFRDFLLTMPL